MRGGRGGAGSGRLPGPFRPQLLPSAPLTSCLPFPSVSLHPCFVGRRGFGWRTRGLGGGGEVGENGRESGSLLQPVGLGCQAGPRHFAARLLWGASVLGPSGLHWKDPGPLAPQGIRKDSQVWSEHVSLPVWEAPLLRAPLPTPRPWNRHPSGASGDQGRVSWAASPPGGTAFSRSAQPPGSGEGTRPGGPQRPRGRGSARSPTLAQ